MTRIYTEQQREAARKRANDYYKALTPEQKKQRYNALDKRRKENIVKDRIYKINSYHRNKYKPDVHLRRLWKYAKARAVKSNLEFNISIEDIFIPEVCPVFGFPFGTDRRTSASIDRIDPNKGYVKGNIRVISQLANAMKWDSNREERLAFANWVLTSEGGL